MAVMEVVLNSLIVADGGSVDVAMEAALAEVDLDRISQSVRFVVVKDTLWLLVIADILAVLHLRRI